MQNNKPLTRKEMREWITGAWKQAQDNAQTTHSVECWRWHPACAVARIERDERLLRQALEALEDYPFMSNVDDHNKLGAVLEALRERLGEKV